MKTASDMIPPQEDGRATDFTAQKTFADISEAHDFYKKSVARLFNVNEWHNYAGPGSSKFQLFNNQGDPTGGYVVEGALIAIDLPIPGSNAGDGLEWVMVEQIDTLESPQGDEEFVTITVRPIPEPHNTDAQIAHFYKEVSTSTFIVKRIGCTVTAGVHGRNEMPNNNGVGMHDKIRNTIVALSARIGLAGPQWKKLVNGLIGDI
ncbi:hypothetical protein [Mucilaginibacter ginkgonis]|uniref:Uncharacterized protein n=1 Tax=Mucilaginibacter ginkgonis TaxID=2682091 RepID=A0A6I4I2W9_9SPHI|nr:hypothetical protein [Mucilaginibacter ginkgonis]QQL49155.1 hypothetical protein GO620_013350 [Mucilaginibacter ginkgonis]